MPIAPKTQSPFTLTSGMNGLQQAVLTAADGAAAEVYLHGAHLTSWIPAGGEERLFLSQKALFDPESSIRGGVPVIFPQFAEQGPLPKHGFARRMNWEFLDGEKGLGDVSAAFLLRENSKSLSLWPHAFLAGLLVTLGGREIEVNLTITNTDAAPFTFTAALHTYLRVTEIRDVYLDGLCGLHYLDSTDGGAEKVQEDKYLLFEDEVDRIYPNILGSVSVNERNLRLLVHSEGFRDLVVWNPWMEHGAALADLEPRGYRNMLCVESATVCQPVTLEPGQSWNGLQRLVDETPSPRA
jgi:glucose-6-phosphate 1-epimerase